MVLRDANNPTVKPNFHDSECKKDDPFVILAVELAMYNRTATRDIHARRIKILISTNRTSSDVSRDGLAPLDPRVLNSVTVIEEAFPHSLMAPLAHNDTCYVFPQSEAKFPGLNSGRNDSQVGNEIFQQRQNVLRFHQEVASEGKVAHNTLTTDFFPASKQR